MVPRISKPAISRSQDLLPDIIIVIPRTREDMRSYEILSHIRSKTKLYITMNMQRLNFRTNFMRDEGSEDFFLWLPFGWTYALIRLKGTNLPLSYHLDPTRVARAGCDRSSAFACVNATQISYFLNRAVINDTARIAKLNSTWYS